MDKVVELRIEKRLLVAGWWAHPADTRGLLRVVGLPTNFLRASGLILNRSIGPPRG
jgi:hypothetical protein